MIDDWQPWHELVASLMLMSIREFKKCSQVPAFSLAVKIFGALIPNMQSLPSPSVR